MVTMEAREIVVFKGDGEGSRGGKIIGHTKSGKPIYGDKDYSHHQSQPGWSKQDHADLIKAHHDKAEEFRTKGAGTSGKFAATMNDRANYHFLQARAAERASVGHLPDGDVSKGGIRNATVDDLPATDRLPGGKADGKSQEDFDPKALVQGTKVESEHTNDPGLAREIAMDHLTEDPAYYDKLAKMEKRELVVFKGASGEGSRGGKIIGHTRSGKPIYESGPNHHEYKAFNGRDHSDASNVHESMAHQHSERVKAITGKGAFHKAQRKLHSEKAAFHSATSDAHAKIAKDHGYAGGY